MINAVVALVILVVLAAATDNLPDARGAVLFLVIWGTMAAAYTKLSARRTA